MCSACASQGTFGAMHTSPHTQCITSSLRTHHHTVAAAAHTGALTLTHTCTSSLSMTAAAMPFLSLYWTHAGYGNLQVVTGK